jgi:thiol-disulfide isomerase/thioredoxin
MFIIKFIVLLLILPQIIFSQEKTFEDQLEKLSDKIKNNPGQYNDYVPYWKIKFRLNEDIESLRNCLEEFERQFSSLRESLGEPDSLIITEALIYDAYSHSIFFVLNNNDEQLDKSNDSLRLRNLVDVYLKEKNLALKKLVKICEKIPEEKRKGKLGGCYYSAKDFLETQKFNVDIREKPAPDFEFTTLDNEKYKLSDFRSKFVLLHFWNTMCDPCINELQSLITAYNKYSRKLKIISINSDKIVDDWDIEVLKKFVSETEMKWLNVADGTNNHIHNLYKVSNWPKLFLLDKEGYAVKFEWDLRGDVLLSTLSGLLE